MTRWLLRPIMYLLLAVLLVLAVIAVTLRLRPDWVLSVVNGVQSEVALQAEGLGITYWPMELSADTLSLQTAGQDIALTELGLGADFSAWRADQPFWQVSADQVRVKPHAGSAAQATTAEAPDPGAEPAAPLDILSLLNFRHIKVNGVDVEGATPIQAKLHAAREGEQIDIDMAGQVGGEVFTVLGTLTRGTTDLGLDLALTLASTSDQTSDQTPATEADEAQAPLAIEAQLRGRLANSDALRLTLADTQLQVGGPQTHLVTELGGELSLSADGDELSIKALTGTYQLDEFEALPWQLDAKVQNLSTAPNFDVTMVAADTRVTAVGEADLAFTNANAKLTLNSDRLPDFVSTDPYVAADLFPLTLATALDLTPTRLAADAIEFESPKIAFTGLAEVGLEEHLDATVDLKASRLYIPLGGNETATAQTDPDSEAEAEQADAEDAVADADSAPAEEAPLFAEEPLDWEWLNSGRLAVAVVAEQLLLGDAPFTEFALNLALTDRLLEITPLRASIDDGGFDASLSLQGQDSGAAAKTKFELQGVALERFGIVPQEELSGGQLDVRGDFTTTGTSVHDLVSDLDGAVTLMVEKATLMNDMIELAGSDLIMETLNKLNPFAKSDPKTDLVCALVHFDVEQGKLTSKRQLVMETSKMEIIGDGSVNLPDERLDITFEPNAKSGVGLNVGSLIKFLKVGGSLTNPRPAADAGGVLKSGLAIGAALSTGGASIVAEGLAKRALNAGSACVAMRKQRGDEPES